MIYAGILAAGIGTRMNRQDLPKQFLPLGEKPVMINTLEQFFVNPQIDRVIVVAPEEWKLYTEDMLLQYNTMGTETVVIAGGKNKTLSVHMLVDFIKSTWGIHESDILLAHDAVRPFITQRIINENIDTAKKFSIANTVSVTNDTIVASEDGETIHEIPIKRRMYAEQTPLTFQLPVLEEVFGCAAEQGIALEQETELARLCIRCGKPVHIVFGESSNMKILTPYDLEVANILLREKYYD